MKVIWTIFALQQIINISHYIAKDKRLAAERWAKAIIDHGKRMARFPKSGRVVPEFKNANIREMLYKNYRIIYQIGNKCIYVLTIRHVKQILSKDQVFVV